MNLFEHDDYKTALKAIAQERRSQYGSKYTFEKMAIACGVQKTYLSKVLNGAGHLNADQLYSACEFLKLKLLEGKFLSVLREFELATNLKRKAGIKAKLDKLKREALKANSVLEKSGATDLSSHFREYFTDINLQLVYLFVTLPRFASNPKSIATAIGIPVERVNDILLKLKDWGLVRFEGAKCITKDPNLHLPYTSDVFPLFASLTRMKAIQKIETTDFSDTDQTFITAIFSAETSFQTKFKKKFLDLLKEMQADVIKAKPEEVYQLNLDLFRWS